MTWVVTTRAEFDDEQKAREYAAELGQRSDVQLQEHKVFVPIEEKVDG